MGKLDGQLAIVTGGASGIGKAVAERLVADGANVVITDNQITVGEHTAAEIGCDFLPHDVTDEGQWDRVIHDVEQRYGELHVLVNNAGILGPMDATDPENTRLSDWQRIFSVNVDGVFLGCRAAIPAMRRSGKGSIINISSVAGVLATPYATAYGASKAAVCQLTRSVAQHCAEQKLDVRCNSVHPGNVLTPLWERQARESAAAQGVPVEEIIAEGAAAAPMDGFTQVEDVAAAVAFLVSDDARRITGTMLMVDGGTTGCDTYRDSAGPASVPSSAHRN